MPYHSLDSPEALLPRSDSKNPSTTCRGLTASRVKCRRDVKNGARRLSAPPTASGGVKTRPVFDSASFYCWQHQDQAMPQQSPQPLHQRESFDTLIARMESLGVQEPEPRPKVKRASKDAASKTPTTSKTSRRPGFWRSLCCAISDDSESDRLEIVRHKQRTQQTRHHDVKPAMAMARPHLSPGPHSADARLMTAQSSSKLTNHTTQHSTSNLLSLFPPSLSPKTTAALLAELSKPISTYDEPGYIYIFWLTDQGRAPPSTDAAFSLLSSGPANQESARMSNSHRQNAVLSHYANPASSQGIRGASKLQPPHPQRDRILLKIGRANNVHRRISEWERQCGHNLSLLRFYPHVPASLSSRSPSMPGPAAHSPRPQPMHSPVSDLGVRKVPFAHRVERLIHIELSEVKARQRGKCSACGREHREWFEVEATRAAVRGVDEVVQRWVSWAETKSRTGDG